MSQKQFREDGHRIDGKWNNPDMHWEWYSKRKNGTTICVCDCGRQEVVK